MFSHPVLRQLLPAFAVSAVGDGISVVAVSSLLHAWGIVAIAADAATFAVLAVTTWCSRAPTPAGTPPDPAVPAELILARRFRPAAQARRAAFLGAPGGVSGPHEGAVRLDQHGVRYGLCRRYDNEPWHFE